MKTTMNYFSKVAFSFLIIAMLVGFSSPLRVGASKSNDLIHVYDNAGLMTQDQVNRLDRKAKESSQLAEAEILIISKDGLSFDEGHTYLEDFYDLYLYDDFPNSILLLIDTSNSDIYLQAHEQTESYININRRESIIDEITPNLSDGNYFEAFNEYIQLSAGYMDDTNQSNYDYVPPTNTNSNKNDNIFYKLWFQILVSLAIGFVTVFVMISNSSGKKTTNSNTYLQHNSHNGLIGKRDTYLRTQVTRVKKPENNNKNGGSGGGSSFSGGSTSRGGSYGGSRGSF